MCVLEAAGAKLPIILRDLPEYNDTFKKDAVLCQSNDEFIEAVRQLEKRDAFYHNQLKATARIARRFDSAAAAQRYVDLYRSLL